MIDIDLRQSVSTGRAKKGVNYFSSNLGGLLLNHFLLSSLSCDRFRFDIPQIIRILTIKFPNILNGAFANGPKGIVNRATVTPSPRPRPQSLSVSPNI